MSTRITPLLLLLASLTAHGQPQSPQNQPAGQAYSPGYTPIFTPAFISIAPGIRIQTSSSAQGYTMVIDSANLPASSIRVDIDRHSLLIHATDQRSVSRQQHYGRNSQMQSYSYSSRSNGFKRRLPLPADANATSTVRTDSERQVTIFIPRTKREPQ